MGQQLGGMADISRHLAYRPCSTCEPKKWAAVALAYTDWSSGGRRHRSPLLPTER